MSGGLLWITCAGSRAEPESQVAPDSQAALTGESATPTTGSAVAAKSPATVVSPQTSEVIPVPTSEIKVATLTTDDLKEYADQPDGVKRLLTQGLALTRLNLSYKYGSADPKNGGMDCSGTVYYLLRQAGLTEVPRDASGFYSWVWKEKRFWSVVSQNPDTFEFDRLKPGDLLFWTGTYRVDHDPPVTHVMIYLGTNRQNGHRVMIGASEGRPFDGKSRYGVSVFDFKLPGIKPRGALAGVAQTGSELESRFIGYGSIPGLEQANPTSAAAVNSAPTSTKG